MNKVDLLRFAKGGRLEPSYYITYEAIGSNIEIHNCSIISNRDEDILFEMDLWKEHEPYTPDDVIKAAHEWMKNNRIGEIEIDDEFYSAIKAGLTITLDID